MANGACDRKCIFKISECVIAHHEDILSSALLCCVRITVYYLIPLHGRVLSFLYLIYVMSPLVAKKKNFKKKGLEMICSKNANGLQHVEI